MGEVIQLFGESKTADEKPRHAEPNWTRFDALAAEIQALMPLRDSSR
jgi:hypothetical protein